MATASRFADLERVRKELAQVQAELERERGQRQAAKAIHQAQLADESCHREETVKAAADEVQALKAQVVGTHPSELSSSSCWLPGSFFC